MGGSDEADVGALDIERGVRIEKSKNRCESQVDDASLMGGHRGALPTEPITASTAKAGSPAPWSPTVEPREKDSSSIASADVSSPDTDAAQVHATSCPSPDTSRDTSRDASRDTSLQREDPAIAIPGRAANVSAQTLADADAEAVAGSPAPGAYSMATARSRAPSVSSALPGVGAGTTFADGNSGNTAVPMRSLERKGEMVDGEGADREDVVQGWGSKDFSFLNEEDDAPGSQGSSKQEEVRRSPGEEVAVDARGGEGDTDDLPSDLPRGEQGSGEGGVERWAGSMESKRKGEGHSDDCQGGPPPSKKPRLDVAEREAYLKKSLIKWFAEYGEYGRYFRGVVRAYDAESDVYKIAYAADDEEDMTYAEVKSLVLRNVPGGDSKEVVNNHGRWYVAAENDTPRRIAAKLARRGPEDDGEACRTLLAEQIVELNRMQYPALVVTSKLQKNTMIFLGASEEMVSAKKEYDGLEDGQRRSSRKRCRSLRMDALKSAATFLSVVGGEGGEELMHAQESERDEDKECHMPQEYVKEKVTRRKPNASAASRRLGGDSLQEGLGRDVVVVACVPLDDDEGRGAGDDSESTESGSSRGGLPPVSAVACAVEFVGEEAGAGGMTQPQTVLRSSRCPSGKSGDTVLSASGTVTGVVCKGSMGYNVGDTIEAWHKVCGHAHTSIVNTCTNVHTQHHAHSQAQEYANSRPRTDQGCAFIRT